MLLAEFVFGLLAVLDNVAFLEKDVLEHSPPFRSPARQELEVHREVLELFLLGVLHDRPRFGILLEREALLVPTDRLRLLDERDADPREGPHFLGELVGWLVVLLERHGPILPHLVRRANASGSLSRDERRRSR